MLIRETIRNTNNKSRVLDYYKFYEFIIEYLPGFFKMMIIKLCSLLIFKMKYKELSFIIRNFFSRIIFEMDIIIDWRSLERFSLP
jgi:hypothetical protein